MGENSAISWTTHTFNPWWGCVKISPACTNCYAAAFDHRLGGDHWGPKSDRKFFGDKHWNAPRKWNRDAEKAGVRERVFCASMADVFEDRDDLNDARTRLYQLIDQTPHLDWLLLTKRPENIANLYPVKWITETPRNVWLGTTVENQEYADERVPRLLDVDAVVHFLSCEPLLGEVSIPAYLRGTAQHRAIAAYAGKTDEPGVDWVIAGCESGPGARPTKVEWLRFLRDQCAFANVPFLLKQAIATPGKLVPGRVATWVIGADDGSHIKGRDRLLVELPYLDGVQHAAFPEVRHG
jgi:protein gp37